MKLKICGISDSKTLKHLTGHPHPPEYIGFIVNYPKSKRFVEIEKLEDLLKIEKKLSKTYVKKFYKKFSMNQWKRERTAPSFHFDEFSVDSSLWLRFPILSNNFKEELKNL